MISKADQEIPVSLSIVIPAFNEEKRLAETIQDLQLYFQSGRSGFALLEVILIDDGSVDKTLDVMTELKRSFPCLRIIHFSDNQGKGAAVKAGLLKAQGQWILIADADQSTPWSEMEVLWQACLQENADMAMGSRALNPDQVQIHQAWWREGMGRIFNRIVRLLFGLPFLDTQCGFKLLKKSFELQRQVDSFQVKRFAWDVEMILKFSSSGLKIIEIPVIWKNKLESRVHPIRDSLEMIFQLLKLKLFLKNNASHLNAPKS